MESDARARYYQWPALIAAPRTLLFTLIVAMCLRGAAIGQGGAGVGSVSAIEGNVTVLRNGRTFAVSQAMALETNDKLITASDSRVTVTFGDSSSLALGPSTSIVINEGVIGGTTSGITRVGLLGGHLHSIINAGLRASGGSFEVHTPNALAGVRGTDFKIAYIAGTPCPGFPKCLRYTDVGVYKGRVQVSNPLNPKARPVIAAAGYETTVPCEEPPAVPSPLGMDEMLAPAYR